jgi:hypothetical protein
VIHSRLQKRRIPEVRDVMKRIVLLVVALLVTFALSVNAAVSARWKSELASVRVAPGALTPTFMTRCALAAVAAVPAALPNCTEEEAAEWLAMWLNSITPEQIDALLAEIDPEGELGYTGDDLYGLALEDIYSMLLETIEAHPEALEMICEARAATAPVVPCTTKRKTGPFGSCISGFECTSPTCTDASGAAKNCITRVVHTTNPLFLLCAFFTSHSYSCDDPCPAPLPSWTLVSGALLALAVLGMRRLRLLWL